MKDRELLQNYYVNLDGIVSTLGFPKHLNDNSLFIKIHSQNTVLPHPSILFYVKVIL